MNTKKSSASNGQEDEYETAIALGQIQHKNGSANGNQQQQQQQPQQPDEKKAPPTTTTVTNAGNNCGVATVPTNVAIPPDGGWGWIVVAASFCCNLVVDGIIYSFGTFLPVLATHFGESKTNVSLVGSLLSGTYLISGPFASALANRYGFRSVTIAGAILSCFSFLISTYATSTAYLCFTFGFLGGIGFGLIFVPAVIVVGFYFEKWRALATGIAVCGSGIGTFIMAPLSNWLIQNYSWELAMIIQAGFLLNCAVFGCLFRPLRHVSVEIPVNNETSSANERTADAEKTKLLLKTKILQDSKGRSESLLSIYEGLGVTADYSADSNNKSYFSSNSKYPTASQILQLDIITDNDEQSNESSDDKRENANCKDRLDQLVVLSNRELNTNPHGDVADAKKKDLRERNKSVSPVLQKRNSLVSERKILLNRKYSLQPHYKSQSFTVASTTTLTSNSKPTINRRHTDMGNRPLYRDDIFFNSNLRRLSQYTSQTSSLNYTMSVTRLPTYADVLEENKKKFSLCPEAMRRALATLFDVSLMKSTTFIILAISGFITSMGMYTPFMFINDRAANSYQLDKDLSIWLISVLGIANTVGRVSLGVLSSIPNTNAILINNISLTLCGLSTMLSGIYPTAVYQFLYVCAFGMTIACFSTLRTIIIVDLLGLENLTNAFGLLLLFQGIAAVIGPPLAGYFLEATGSYDIPFYISGALIILSAAICYPIETINKWEKVRKSRHIKPEC